MGAVTVFAVASAAFGHIYLKAEGRGALSAVSVGNPAQVSYQPGVMASDSGPGGDAAAVSNTIDNPYPISEFNLAITPSGLPIGATAFGGSGGTFGYRNNAANADLDSKVRFLAMVSIHHEILDLSYLELSTYVEHHDEQIKLRVEWDESTSSWWAQVYYNNSPIGDEVEAGLSFFYDQEFHYYDLAGLALGSEFNPSCEGQLGSNDGDGDPGDVSQIMGAAAVDLFLSPII